MAEQAVLNLEDLRVRPVQRSEEQRHRQLMAAHHYLGFLPKIGQTLWYVATYHKAVGGPVELFGSGVEMRGARSVDRLGFSPPIRL